MAVSRRLRYEILRRDNHACRYCGATAPDVKLTVDHVVPSALGGSDDPTNLVTACAGCNGGKSASTPDAALVADVSQKAAQWGQAMQVAIEIRTAELAADRARFEAFDRAWQAWGNQPREADWKGSVARFLAAGLDDQFLADAIDTAMGNRKITARDIWRYFCGICWREIDKIRDKTADLLAVGDAQPKHVAEGEAMPAGVGLDPRFDVLNLSDRFLADLLEHLDVPNEARQLAHAGYWSCMEDTYKAFRRDPSMADLFDEEEDERLEDFFDSSAAYFMYHIQQAVRADRSVPDGS